LEVLNGTTAEDLGINANMLHRWVREQEGNRSKVSGDKNEAG
jgi:transposase-like protein